jgi:hypothetical protein
MNDSQIVDPKFIMGIVIGMFILSIPYLVHKTKDLIHASYNVLADVQNTRVALARDLNNMFHRLAQTPPLSTEHAKGRYRTSFGMSHQPGYVATDEEIAEYRGTKGRLEAITKDEVETIMKECEDTYVEVQTAVKSKIDASLKASDSDTSEDESVPAPVPVPVKRAAQAKFPAGRTEVGTDKFGRKVMKSPFFTINVQ